MSPPRTAPRKNERASAELAPNQKLDRAPVLVSACLAGLPCRYDGLATPHPQVLRLAAEGRILPVCPEQLGGLPTPRPPVELRPREEEMEACAERDHVAQKPAPETTRRACTADGVDLSVPFARGVAAVCELARQCGCREAILKSRSPSCGVHEIYDGSFQNRRVTGQGLLAEALAKAGLRLRSEEDLEQDSPH